MWLLAGFRTGATPCTLSSDTLFMGQQQIRIEHFGAPYRLKIPGQGR
ncbi:Hemin uptake protein hemP [Mesorhizobium sp. LNJC384A00]|nr:hemin uptake protein HemP [Mesorhizobium sp. LNJC384A00]ESY42985.1 Hemin uptake protein hemP [Mesorhizobium sp. LNJC384A00]